MAIYMYSAGSPFEDVLNGYMSTGKGLNPYNIPVPPMFGNTASTNQTSINGTEESVLLESATRGPYLSGGQTA